MSLKTKITDFSKVLTGGMNRLHGAIPYCFVADTFDFTTGSQKFPLDFEGEVISVFVNGVSLDSSQYDEQYMRVEILDTLEPGDYIQVRYLVKTDLNNEYGIEWDKTAAAPEVTKIGNMDLHAGLPIQSQMKRCTLLDDGTVNYYLDPADSTKKANGTAAVLDGSDGQIMVEIPRHWRRSEWEGNMRRIYFSAKPMPGGEEIPKMYVSAYKAALNRSNNKLSSVLNLTADYRGGNNQAAWDADNEYKSQLGKPVTYKDSIQLESYANNRGNYWHEADYHARCSIGFLITCEYGTRHHQSISEGATNFSSADWATFNGRYPLFRCGTTNHFGNSSGEVQVTVQDFPAAGQSAQTQVFSYRGIESFWGDIWEWTNGVNVINDVFYMAVGKTDPSGLDGYKPVGPVPSPGYITDMYPGTTLPSETTSGSSGTYWTDYYYYNGGDAGLLCSGAVYSGAPAGSFIVHSNHAPTAAYSTVGSRLCFLKR